MSTRFVHQSRLSLRHVCLLLAGFSISACTAILVPNADDDGVNRCNTSADCPDLDDNRYAAICTAGEGQPDNSDQVCSSNYAEVSCGPTAYAGDHPLTVAYDSTQVSDSKAAYGACAMDNLGKQGCPQPMGGCESGLEPNDDNICDVADPDIPAIHPADVGLGDIAGQDALDQFCRNFFCDERFVCDTSLSKPVCVACNSSDPYAEGGCGTLYIQGSISPIYTDVEDTGNCDGDRGDAAVPFGDAPVMN